MYFGKKKKKNRIRGLDTLQQRSLRVKKLHTRYVVNSLGLERKSATSICDPETPKTEQKAVPVVDSVGG